MIYKIIAILVLLLFSAFFSGSETAFFSLNSLVLNKIRHKKKDISKIKYLLHDPVKLLATILIGNMLVNVAASSIAASLAIDIYGDKGIGVSIGVMTFLLLLFGEVSPKRYAIAKPIKYSLMSAGILVYVSKVFYPFQLLLNKFINKILLFEEREPTLSEEELKTVIDIGHREGVVGGEEKKMIGAVLRFSDKIVKNVITKRENVKAASIDLSHEEFIKFAKEIKHSKIPIYKNSMDNIVGIVYTKELFLYSNKSYKDIIKPVLFMYDQRKIKDILEVFENQNIKIAIVFDEKGVVSGLVTMEDIIEEVFGEIYDEFEIQAMKKKGSVGDK